MHWATRSFIGWCRNCNLPIIGSKCDICKKKANAIYIRNKGEIRPLFEEEISYFNKLLEQEYSIPNIIPLTSFMNDSSNSNDFAELIIDGSNICKFSYNNNQWNIKPYIELANYLVTNNIKKKFVEIQPFLARSILALKNPYLTSIINLTQDIKKDDYIIIKSGNVVAVGVFPVSLKDKDNKSAKLNILESKLIENKPFRGTDIEKVVKANKTIMSNLEGQATKEIQRHTKKFNKSLVSSFSGGKDSIVVLDLVLKTLPNNDVDVIFVDTENEFQETHEYIGVVERFYNIKITQLKPKKDIFELWDDFGPPTYQYRWCCKTQKFAPLNNYIKKKYPDGILSFLGTRMNESMNRALSISDISSNSWINNQTMFLPIHKWSELEVWIHILKNNLPINTVYKKGIRRCGCWSCPATHIALFDLMKTTHPKLINKLKNNLNKFSKIKHNDPIELIDKWKRNGKNGPGGSKYTKFSPCQDGTKYYNFSNSKEVMLEFLKMFGDIDKSKKIIRIKGIIDAAISNSKLIIKGFDKEKLKELKLNESYILAYLEKQVHKAEHCVACALCQPQCPSGAISVNPRFKIDETKCIRCLRCIKGNCSVISFFEKDNRILK